jgi:alanyl-tRNA synthetase
MTGWVDSLKNSSNPRIIVAYGKVEGKPAVIVAATENTNVDVGAILKELLPTLGGRGGGKSHFAQGGVGVEVTSDILFSKIQSRLNGGNAHG